MRILLTSDAPYIPQLAGGVSSSTHELAIELAARGHEVSVFCTFSMSGFVGWRARLLLKLQKHRFVKDEFLGYPVYRQNKIYEDVAAASARIDPEVVVIQPKGNPMRLAGEFEKIGVPIVMYFRDVEISQLHGDPSTLRCAGYIANSRFTADRFKSVFGIDCAVIPPLFHAKNYATRRTPENVTFINPHPYKGVHLALAIAARCPDIEFAFVRSWALEKDEERAFRAGLKGLRNVTVRPRTRNMKTVYAKTKILIAPSIWEEAWGRVVTEAHFSGIPVVASNRGGLPESVGPGGVLLDPEGPIEMWVEAVRRLWADEQFYAEKSAAARAYSRRPELDPQHQIETLLATAKKTIDRCSDQGGPSRQMRLASEVANN